MHQTHDPTKNAKLSSQGRAWAGRDPPLGAGHEKPEAGTAEPETGQTQPHPGETFSAELLSPLYEASNMGGNEELKYNLGDPGMNSSLSPSQTFVKDLLG